MKYRAVVTGATRGIGYAIAERLLKDGLEVIVTGTKKNGKHPAGATYYQVDFLDEDSTNKFINFLKKQQINVLVNNAGINKISKFSSIDIDDFDRILRVNLRAPFQICQAVIPHMEKIKWGRIVNLTSVFGNISKEYRAAYSSSKFGLDGMTVALAAEVSEKGILANSVGPGFIDTDMTKELPEANKQSMLNQIPLARLGSPDEIASVVSFLAGEAAGYITGETIHVNGGMYMA